MKPVGRRGSAGGPFKPRDKGPDSWEEDFEIEPEPEPEYGDFWPELNDDGED